MSSPTSDASIGQPVAQPSAPVAPAAPADPAPVDAPAAPVAPADVVPAAPSDPPVTPDPSTPDAAPGGVSASGDVAAPVAPAVPDGAPAPVPDGAPVGGSGHDLAWHVMLGTVEGYVGQMRATFHSALSMAVEHAKAIAAVDKSAIEALVADERALFESLNVHFK